jgi:hypothetical protein
MEALLAPLPPVAVRNSSILTTEMTKEEGLFLSIEDSFLCLSSFFS